MKNLTQLVFPPQCLSCGEQVERANAICGACWRDLHILTGLTCDLCGVPMPGEPDGSAVHCDDCLTLARPWASGRAALAYSGTARRLILGLKHGDRLDLVGPLKRWMLPSARALLQQDSVLVPVPLHRFRLLRRRFNQAAVLAQALARDLERVTIPDLLIRQRQTKPQDGMTRDARFANQGDAIVPHGTARRRLAERAVMLIDDVMTSGATLAAATEACHAAGARRVDVLALARVVKDT